MLAKIFGRRSRVNFWQINYVEQRKGNGKNIAKEIKEMYKVFKLSNTFNEQCFIACKKCVSWL